MVKKISYSTMASARFWSKAVETILAVRAEVSRLRHHVCVVSQRLHRLEPNRLKPLQADANPPSVIEADSLGSAGGGKAVEKEECG